MLIPNTSSGGALGMFSINATNIPILDCSNYFDATNVEEALKELYEICNTCCDGTTTPPTPPENKDPYFYTNNILTTDYTQSGDLFTYNITHNLNTEDIIFDCYDSNKKKVTCPYTIIDLNTIQIQLLSPIELKYFINSLSLAPNYGFNKINVSKNQSNFIINHSLGESVICRAINSLTKESTSIIYSTSKDYVTVSTLDEDVILYIIANFNMNMNTFTTTTNDYTLTHNLSTDYFSIELFNANSNIEYGYVINNNNELYLEGLENDTYKYIISKYDESITTSRFFNNTQNSDIKYFNINCSSWNKDGNNYVNKIVHNFSSNFLYLQALDNNNISVDLKYKIIDLNVIEIIHNLPIELNIKLKNMN